jgi:hypothetical protein
VFGYVGVWRNDRGWDLPDPTHTIVETFDDGWAWSVPLRGVGAPGLHKTAAVRHVGVMVGESGSRYSELVAKTRCVGQLLESASLERTFACDASTYSSSTYAGLQFLLAGDAGSFIDPLSSFGVKKALASAWLGAVAHCAASREFARVAYERHGTEFWDRRRGEIAPVRPSHDDLDVAAVFERFKSSPSINLRLADRPLERRPVVRGREIVVEDALAGGLRFVGNVDLLKLAEMATRHRQVPDLFEAYCRDCSPVPLPSVVTGLSLLVAKGILHERT